VLGLGAVVNHPVGVDQQNRDMMDDVHDPSIGRCIRCRKKESSLLVGAGRAGAAILRRRDVSEKNTSMQMARMMRYASRESLW